METKEFKTLRYNEAINNGLFDMIKSAIPSIGKAAMGAFKTVVGDSANSGSSSGCYKASLGTSDNGEESMSPTSYETKCSNGGAGVISCLGYFTKKMLDKPLYLNSHIVIEAIGNSLKISLRGGIEVQYAQGLSIRQSDGGAEKNFSKVFATRDAKESLVSDDSDAYVLLDNALDGYEMDDDLMIVGDLVFVNVTGQRLRFRTF